MTAEESTKVELALSPIDEYARGPTDYSHWGKYPRIFTVENTARFILSILTSVIPRRLLASAYPASKDRKEHLQMTEQFIIKSSVQVIVNLMETEELIGFTPYEELMKEYAQKGLLIIINYLFHIHIQLVV